MKYEPVERLIREHTYTFPANYDVWCIGDVHGCAEEYHNLCSKVILDSASKGRVACIVQLGDMIDRGPHFRSLILGDPADIRIMGNHEWNFILERMGKIPCRSRSRQESHEKFNGYDSLDQESILRVLKRRKQFAILEVNGRRFIASHAPPVGLEKGLDLPGLLHWSKIPDWAMRAKPVLMDLIDQSKEEITYIHGHQSWNYSDIRAQVKVQESERVRVFNLDSGCVYGGELVALNLVDDRVISVSSNVRVEKNSRTS